MTLTNVNEPFFLSKITETWTVVQTTGNVLCPLKISIGRGGN